MSSVSFVLHGFQFFGSGAIKPSCNPSSEKNNRRIKPRTYLTFANIEMLKDNNTLEHGV